MYVKDKLGKQIASLDKNQDFGMVYSAAIAIDEDGNEVFRYNQSGNKKKSYYEATESGWIYNKIAFYLPLTIILPSVMVRSKIMSVIGDFDEDLYRFEDLDMWRRISKKSKILAINEPLCIVRTHSGNKMENPEDLYESQKKYVAKIFSEDRDVGLLYKLKGTSNFYLHYGVAVWKNPDYKKSLSFKFFFQYLKYWPFNIFKDFFILIFGKRP